MKVTVKQILTVEEKTSKAGKTYKLTSFLGEDGQFYKDVYGALEVGKEYEGEMKDGKFEIARSFGGFGGRSQDPATRASIERQSALKAAVEAVHDYYGLMGITQDEKNPFALKTYIAQIVNVTNVFATATATGAPAVEAKPAPKLSDVVIEDIPDAPINLDEIPF